MVRDVAEKLAQLTNNNDVELHFIPSHTEDKIPQSEEINKLAKYAAELGEEEIEHDPLVSSYKLKLKKREKFRLLSYLENNVKPSKFPEYPGRAPLIDGKFENEEDANTRLDCNNVLLNRARTGHTRARVHLKNIKLETEDTCRHCKRHRETVEHQLLKCKIYKKQLKTYRDEYKRQKIPNFNKALYTHSIFMGEFLSCAYYSGCYI